VRLEREKREAVPMDDPDDEASPEAEAAWLAGRVAGAEGQDATANPYPPGSDLALDWTAGWLEGERLQSIVSPEEEMEAWRKLG
jgi:hypothetical protein